MTNYWKLKWVQCNAFMLFCSLWTFVCTQGVSNIRNTNIHRNQYQVCSLCEVIFLSHLNQFWNITCTAINEFYLHKVIISTEPILEQILASLRWTSFLRNTSFSLFEAMKVDICLFPEAVNETLLSWPVT